jgi:hypothetical protein
MGIFENQFMQTGEYIGIRRRDFSRKFSAFHLQPSGMGRSIGEGNLPWQGKDVN